MSIFTPKQLTIEFFVALLGVSLAAQSAPPPDNPGRTSTSNLAS